MGIEMCIALMGMAVGIVAIGTVAVVLSMHTGCYASIIPGILRTVYVTRFEKSWLPCTKQ